MEKVWLNSYPADVPHTLDFDALTSIPDAFEKCCEQFREHHFFSHYGIEKTYGEIHQQACHFSSFLQKHLQLERGERFAIILPNILQFPIALFGALLAGLIVVTVNPFYKSRELSYQLRDAQVTAVIVLENFSIQLQNILSETEVRHVIVTRIGDCLGFWKGGMMRVISKYIQRTIPSFSISNAIDYKTAIRQGAQVSLKKVIMQPDDLAFLQYTAGTGGPAKGASLTHRNILSNIEQSLALFRSILSLGSEVIVTALPLYHIFSLTVCCLNFMSCGAKNLLIMDPKDCAGMIRILQKNPATIFVGVNTLMKNLLHHPQFNRVDFSKLKLVVTGGMATQSSIAEEWQKKTGVVVSQGYGLTEASPVVSMNPVNVTQYTGSVGLPLPGTEISIRDDRGVEVPLGGRGELCVRGPQVMQGYWHRVEETRAAIDSQGWLKTGDMACMDQEGFLYIVDRKKDMILVSGFNVYPNEVEAVIALCFGVLEVAVIGVSDEETGEKVKACIVRKDPESVTEDDILQYCRQQLAPYKIPKVIEFRESLPKNTVGKVLRRMLRGEQASKK